MLDGAKAPQAGVNSPLRVLIVEDSEADAELLARELRLRGGPVHFRRVDTAPSMREALEREPWDVVISDWAMPDFGALAALDRIKQTTLDLPLIVVSGAVGEEAAVDAMRAGACDYVLKDNLARLAPAVEREVRAAKARAVRQRTESTLASIGDGIIATDAREMISFVNAAAAAMTGWNAVDAIGKNLMDVFRLVDGQGVALESPVKHVLQEGLAVELPNRTVLVSKSGKAAAIDETTSPIRDALGALHGWVVVFRDLTERQRAEDALRASEAKYRQIVETTHEGVLVTTADGHVSFVNRRMEQMLGYEPNEMLGKSRRELMDDEWHALAQKFTERRRKGIAEGGEFKIRRKDGEYLWVLFEANPIMDAAGKFVGVLAMMMDITERRRIDDRLRKSEAQLREAQEVAHVGSWEWNIQTNMVTRSEEMCRILGLTQEESTTGGPPVVSTVHPEDRERVRLERDAALRERKPYSSEHRIVRADGTRFVHARGEAVYSKDGTPIRMFGIVQDVTERRSIEARMLLSDRMASVGTLAAGVAHEINNPLAYVTANLDLIAEELRAVGEHVPAARLRELETMTREARQGAERVRKIVRGLKTFSRAEEERAVPLDVRAVLDLSINMAFNELRHRARLVKDYRDVPLVEADEARLGQVFINLIINAAHSIPEGRPDRNEVRLTTRSDEAGRAVVEVRDTGAGIPYEHLGRIFEPFFTTKAVGAGTGLGLSICHGIVTGFGGELTVESEVGNGSAFRVVLPAVRFDRPPPVAARPSTLRPVRRGRVLVVDDDVMVGKTIARTLGEHEVTVVTSARDALDRLLAGERFDAILCDLMMPGMTGMGFYEALSGTLPEQAERIVFLSGGAFTPSARTFLDTVPNERMEKPFDMHNLRAVVQRFLR